MTDPWGAGPPPIVVMAEPVTPPPVPPPVPPVTPGPGCRRVWRGLLAPARLAYRWPVRTAILFSLSSVLIGAAAVWGWFGYHLRSARAEVDRGHNAAASAHLRACRWVRPDHPEVLLLAARVARRAGFWGEADAFLDRYWQRYGDDEGLVFERVLLRATRGDIEATAPILLARVREGGPASRTAREALVTGLVYRFLWVEAGRQLADWLATDPDDPLALLLRGKLQEQRLRTSEALLTYRRVVELDPEQHEARLRMTTLLLQLRQGEEAAGHLAYLRARLPENPEIQVQWVRALSLQGRTAEARAALDECLAAHPDLPEALAERGRFALADGDDRAAEEYFGRAVRADPGNVPARHQYALVLARNGKPGEAAAQDAAVKQLQADQDRIAELISGPLQTRPHDPTVPHEIALIALRAGRPADALRWFQTAIQIDPDHAPAHQELAKYYQAAGDPALAAHHRAIAQRAAGPKNP